MSISAGFALNAGSVIGCIVGRRMMNFRYSKCSPRLLALALAVGLGTQPKAAETGLAVERQTPTFAEGSGTTATGAHPVIRIASPTQLLQPRSSWRQRMLDYQPRATRKVSLTKKCPDCRPVVEGLDSIMPADVPKVTGPGSAARILGSQQSTPTLAPKPPFAGASWLQRDAQQRDGQATPGKSASDAQDVTGVSQTGKTDSQKSVLSKSPFKLAAMPLGRLPTLDLAPLASSLKQQSAIELENSSAIVGEVAESTGEEYRPVDPEVSSTGDSTAVNQSQLLVAQGSLSGTEVACRAANNWSPSRTLRSRGTTVVNAFCDEDQCSRAAAAAINRFLHTLAAHQEDIGAASALRAYYSRIVIADQLVIVANSIEFAEQQRASQRALVARGVSSSLDTTELDRKHIGLLDKAASLNSRDAQLSKLLMHLSATHFDAAGPGLEVVEIQPQLLNCSALVDYAVATRCDINAWRYLYGQVNEDTAPIIAKMLSTAVGGFSLPLPEVCRLKDLLGGKQRYERLATDMRREIGCVIAAHRDWITKAVIEKCSNLELAYQRKEFADQIVQSWNERIEQLVRLERLGNAQPADLIAARSELLLAQSELASRKLDAKIAEVDLAEAVGGLANRCCQNTPWLVTGY